MMTTMMIMVAKNRIRGLPLKTVVTRAFSTAPPSGENKRLYRRLSALGTNPGVTRTLDEWVKEGKAVTESKLVNIVKELRRYKNYKPALKVIDWMEKRGFGINESIHAMRLDLIAKSKTPEIAEKYFSKLPELAKNQFTYGALLNIYCQEKAADKALSLYEKMKELNLASNTLVTNNIMTLHLKLGQHEKIPTLFQEMESLKISPDRITYGILMSSYASRNDIESVEKVVDEMKRGGRVGFDWSLWCNLAGYYNSSGFFEKAESVLKNAEKMMPSGDREAYHFLITLYAGAGNLSEVKRVWRLLKDSFRKMTNMSYYHMFHALKKLGDVDELKKIFEEWELHFDHFDVKLVNVVLDAYLEKGMIKEAEIIWENAISKGCGSDFRTFELFAKYYLEQGERDLATKLLERYACILKQEKGRINEGKAKKFIEHLVGVKDVDGVEAFCKSFKDLVCLYPKKKC
ncbi:uncharacterized protein A4U43_C05F1800 [Asparagus officinalis]|uniref:Pentacotripeptide-repeat region of PRORP domain-containing protein n=1 Tax=Asparagus officinalis TaxID=4686 RepID=A0A5P1EPM7_ASPOF|nr:pentatricopeptide repeat-containing protein At4g01990, mitochondrial-like [Asparagus officinalis]XP_020265040.1 pentatricopeptide repeat-containing protein At4g01990, mitochondrial-like [Asparagus officinalis]ONK67603.1 uncharacterized protein A4U43_C05F1800 [Asparagus officinalis]